MIASSGAGTKDMGQSLFSIWKDIFSAPNARYRNSASRADFGKIEKPKKKWLIYDEY